MGVEVNKKSIIIAISVLVVLFACYEFAKISIKNAIDDSNRRGLEVYVSTIRYTYAKSYLNRNGEGNTDIDSLDIKTNVNVVCEEKSIDILGNIELHGCTIDGSKTKYGYVKNNVIRE